MSVCVTPPLGDRASQQTSCVVIVGSDVHHLFSLAMLLQRFNYRVCTGKSGEEALEMSAIAVPSLIITELDLPGMSGLDLFHRLRQDPRAASVPFIAVVGGGDEELRGSEWENLDIHGHNVEHLWKVLERSPA